MNLAGICYFSPWERATWDRALAARPGFIVINPSSGPGLTLEPAYVDLVVRAQALDVPVLGYVATTYATKPHQAVQAECDAYRTRYGIDGIFFDEVSPDLAGVKYLMILNGKAKSYRTTRSPDGKGWAVFNAGTAVGRVPMLATGTALWVAFEGPDTAYTPGARTPYPAREMHLVYAAADPTTALRSIEASGIGWGFATDDTLEPDGNPWNSWPRLLVNDSLLILGPPLVTELQAVTAFVTRNPHRDHAELETIIGTYAEVCAKTGVSLAAALGQMAHETGWLTSWWSQNPRRNLAGVGVTGATSVVLPGPPAAYDSVTGKWRLGLSFVTYEDAVVGHVGRLLGYALQRPAMTAAQQHTYDSAVALRPLPPAVRGTAQRIRELSGAYNPSGSGWAPGTDYGAGIARAINMIIST